MTVYLLHFERPYHHARHYVGFTREDLERRLEEHRRGIKRGARIMQVLHDEGIGFEVARIWKGKGQDWERKIKNTHSSGDYCPICQGQKVREYRPRKKNEPVLVDMSTPIEIEQPAEELSWLPY